MGTAISTTNLRRRGYTLVECMVASAILATGAAAICGSVSASYQNDKFATTQTALLDAADVLLEQAVALPVADGTLADTDGYSETVTDDDDFIDAVDDADDRHQDREPADATQTASAELRDDDDESTPTRTVTRAIAINRDSSLAGLLARNSGGRLVLVEVTAVDTHGNAVTLRRLVHAAESE